MFKLAKYIPKRKIRNTFVERVVSVTLMIIAAISVAVSIGIVVTLLVDSISFFREVSIGEVFSTDLRPLRAIGYRQAGILVHVHDGSIRSTPHLGGVGGVIFGLGSRTRLAFSFDPPRGNIGIENRIENRALLILEGLGYLGIQALDHQGAVVFETHQDRFGHGDVQRSRR